MAKIKVTLSVIGKGAGTPMTPPPLPEVYLGVKHGILIPQIVLERNVFWYTPTRCY